MSYKAGNSKEKRGAKVNFKTMIIAMIVALLAFLRLGNFELGDGTGDGDNQDASNDVYNESTSESDQSQDKLTSNGENVENSYSIYVKGEEILVPSEIEGEFTVVSLSFIEEHILTLDSQTRILLYDDGAVNKSYLDVKTLVEKSKLRFDEFITNN